MKRKSIKFAAMMFAQAERLLTDQLQRIYDAREAANIADWVMEHLTGLKKIDRLIVRDKDVGSADVLDNYLKELLAHKPVQYVLHEAWFYGMKFFVDESVLIPRPETEELVQWVITENQNEVSILDVGTGSGCIAIALTKKLARADVKACDISEDALAIAKRNAASLDATVEFAALNILDRSQWALISELDIIVSNPPYIPLHDKSSMAGNVVRYEPHLALFVDDNNPLIFYRSIAELGLQKLCSSGKIYVEIHEELALQTAEVFTSAGYKSIEIKRDLQGKERMVRAIK